MYPIGYEADFNPTPNRWTTFFRIILAIPWIIVASVYLILFAFTHLFAWVAWSSSAATRSGSTTSTPASSASRSASTAWVYLQTDAWPPFGLSDDPTYPIRVNIAPAAERQSRLKAFFRLVLVLPMLVALLRASTTSTPGRRRSPG